VQGSHGALMDARGRGSEQRTRTAFRLIAPQWPKKSEMIIHMMMANAMVKVTVRTLTRMRLAASSRR